MLGWIKDKIGGSVSYKAADAVRVQFRPLEQLPGSGHNLADRIARFVFTGEDEEVVAQLAAMQHTLQTLNMSSLFIYSSPPANHPGLLSPLLKLLPEDPELYLRLALVYEAVGQSGTGTSYSTGFYPIPAFQGSLSWLGTFLCELSRGGTETKPIFPAGLLREMIRANGQDPDVLVRGAFFYEDAQGKGQISRWIKPPFSHFQSLNGFPELVLNLVDAVRPSFQQREAGSRACVLRALSALEIAPDRFAEEIASLAVSGSKEVRESAAPLVAEHFSVFKSLLEKHAEKGSADERYHAIRLLGRIGGDEERGFLTQRLDSEKSAKICDAIREVLSEPLSQPTADVVEDYGLTAIPEVPVRAPLDKEFLVELRRTLEEIERTQAAIYATDAQVKQLGLKRTPSPPDAADRLFERLQSFVVKDGNFRQFENTNVDAILLQNYPIPAQFQLIHVVRWCYLLSGEQADANGKLDRWTLAYRWARPLLTYERNQKKPIDLRELAAVFRTIGLDDQAIGRAALQTNRFGASPFLRSDPNLIWPYFAERLHLLEKTLGLKQAEEIEPRNYWEQDERKNAFRVLKLFPFLPARFVPFMWDLALGASKTERPLAQECLDNFPNKEQKIVAALASRQQDARLAAAQWLAALQYKEAVPALRDALSKEKSEVVKDELIKSLETLGVKLEEILDLSKLDDEAERGLKKGMPKELDWFPFDQLPTVRWADSGAPVSTTIIHWFLLYGYKLKTSEANPTLRRYCSLFQKEDREKLGRFVLEAWIAKDTTPKYTSEQAAAEAQKIARQTALYAKQYPQYYPDFDEQRLYQSQFNMLATLPEGSENSTKGILAVAGACCGGDAAPVVHRYIKQWYGYRAAQCKALLQVLAWVDDPSATQVILSVANRFRTKGIQEEAVRQCQMLAERKGWTMDELADRTIPTAGFDESGTMELDYGSRKFTVSLSEEMAIVVTNQNGKVIASLPDANQSDDPDNAKQAKAALSNARKELKSVLSMQRDRMYEALCTQRTWRFEDWDTYLRQHPIVGRYCQRLVWVAYDGERAVESFRPLADGSLTNTRDDEVTLKPETSIRLGHDETLAAEDRTAWLQHFSDYEVEPLFQQFGKPTFTLPERMKEEREITEFKGYIVKAFSLRNRLTRLGYTRGQTQDGGWFFDYKKTFLRLGIEAVIEFTGNGLPEENRTVALTRLFFSMKTDDSGPYSEELALGELPRVLLAECWNDIRMAAADGPGFAPDWEKQTEV